jgi:hypothetical protein
MGARQEDIYQTTLLQQKTRGEAAFGGERGASEGNKVRMKEQNEL